MPHLSAARGAFRSSLLLSLIILATGAGAQEFSSLEERMTAKEFEAAGLHKLSPEELAALNRWLQMRSIGNADPAAIAALVGLEGQGGDRRGFDDFRGKPTPIKARIEGTFNGWSGETVFKLDNGMVWKQAQQDKLGVRPVENPEITIEPAAFGSWVLRVPGVGKRVKVIRIQ